MFPTPPRLAVTLEVDDKDIPLQKSSGHTEYVTTLQQVSETMVSLSEGVAA